MDFSRDAQLPANFSDQVKEVFARLRQLLTAETMEEHTQAIVNFTKDISWDVHPLLLNGRDMLRVSAYRVKYVASADLEPILAEVMADDSDVLTIQYLATLAVHPKRTWVNPLGFLLPRELRPTVLVAVTLGSRKRISDISSVQARVVNWPQLPTWVRAVNGWLWGGLALATEPLWSRLVHLLGDASYAQAAAAKTN